MELKSISPAGERRAIGAEIGTRGLRVALCDESGTILDSVRALRSPADPMATLDSVSRLIDQLLDRHNGIIPKLDGIGIAFGGPVDTHRGVTIASSRSLGFNQFPLAGLVEERYDLPTLVENDARAAAFGEYLFGAGRGSHSMIYIQLGIGVGGGIIFNGQLHHGIAMTAGEFGHMPVTSDGPRCSCGKPGHLEAYVSSSALIERMQGRLKDAVPRLQEFWFDETGVTVQRIFERRESHELAGEIAYEAIRMIGLALANLVSALSFDAVVIGGYANELDRSFVADVRARIRQHAFDAAGRRAAVSTGQLGDSGALIGATALTFQQADSTHPGRRT